MDPVVGSVSAVLVAGAVSALVVGSITAAAAGPRNVERNAIIGGGVGAALIAFCVYKLETTPWTATPQPPTPPPPTYSQAPGV